jgi:putative oxidoreductase
MIGFLNSLAQKIGSHRKRVFRDVGLLLLRVSIGGMMAAAHGWGKLLSFSEKSGSFPDPLSVSPQVSMGLAIGAELFCSIALVLGLFTRLATLPLIITMLVAVLIIHGDDPWAKKELATLYLIPFVCLLFTGPGRFSLDAKIFKGGKE